MDGIVQQPMNFIHPWAHKRSDAGRRDVPQALQCGGQPEQVVRGGKEEEAEESESEEREEDAPAAQERRAGKAVHSEGRGRYWRRKRDATADFGCRRSAAEA